MPKWILLKTQMCPNLVTGLDNESGGVTEYKMETTVYSSSCYFWVCPKIWRKDFIYLKTCSFLQFIDGGVLYTWSQLLISFSETWCKINVENLFINAKVKDYKGI